MGASQSVLWSGRSVPPACGGDACRVEWGSNWHRNLAPLHEFLQEFPNASVTTVRSAIRLGRLRDERVYQYWFGDLERAIQLARTLTTTPRSRKHR